jgi:sec-independent protein translocase protein TatC
VGSPLNFPKLGQVFRARKLPGSGTGEPAAEESFVSHLVELRDRIVRSLIVIVLLFGVSFFFAGEIMNFLARPLQEAMPPGARMVITDSSGTFFTLMKVSFMVAVLASLPWVLYQAWAFVAPGLYEHEKRFAVPLIFSSVFFLLVGVTFAYLFVLPAAYRFFFAFNAQTGAETMQDIQKYWDFTLSIFFGFGLTFEVPVVEMLLVKLGMVTTLQLREARRYVIVGAFVVAAVLTPPDPLSQFMLAIPLCLLYELGIWLAGFVRARSVGPEAEGVADAATPTDKAEADKA